MTSRPTALRALLIAIPAPGFNSYAAAKAVEERIEQMIPEVRAARSIRMLHRDEECTREALRVAICEWVKGAERGQPHLLYFHGHGGRASFADLPEDQATRISYYLQVLNDEYKPTSGLLDVELSGWMNELHERCGGNLTVVIDSCHSAGAVKGPSKSRESRTPSKEVQSFESTPWWIKKVLAESEGLSLAAASHPGIVRLTASSGARRSYAPAGGMGRFTRYLLETLKLLGDEWWRCSWTLLAHHVRQWVIKEGRRESQWVSLAGPGERLLFSMVETPPARAVGLVYYEDQRWLRAGALTGVRLGDQWAPLSPLAKTGDSVELERCSAITIDETPQENRARLSAGSAGGAAQRVLQPYAATLVRAATPTAVEVVDCPIACLGLAETTWLKTGDARARYLLRAVDGPDGRVLELDDRQGGWASVRVRDGAEGRAELLELLEDRARGERLLEVVRAIEGGVIPKTTALPIELEFGLEHGKLAFTGGPARIEPGQALWIAARNTEAVQANAWQTYFLALVLIDGIGRPLLLNAGQADGIELGPQEHGGIGRRLGAARRGVVIDWPTAWRERFVTPPGDQRIELLCLMCDRPLPLAHLTHVMPGSDDEAFHLQGIEPPAVTTDKGKPVVKSEGEPAKPEPPEHRFARAKVWGVKRYELCLGGLREK